MNHIVQLLQKARRVVIVSHEDPDGDAIGSVLALGLALEKGGKRITLHNPNPIPAIYRFLPEVDRFVKTISDPAEYDIAVVLDCGDQARLGPSEAVILQVPLVLNIDHHATNTRFGTHHFVNSDAAASCEIVYQTIKALSIPMDRNMAMAIYTGILTDTGSFRFPNTSLDSFDICREMVSFGVNPSEVARHVYGTYSMGRLKLLNLALDTIELANHGRLSMMSVTRNMFREAEAVDEDADGLVNYARRIEDVKVAALIHERHNGNGDDGGAYHVSLRSDGSVDVAAIAGQFGGGGHKNAAGFSATGSLRQLKTRIVGATKPV